MLNMIPKEFWPIIYQELKSRSSELRILANEMREADRKEQLPILENNKKIQKNGIEKRSNE